MSLKKIGSRDSTAFELDDRGSSSKAGTLGDSRVPWMSLAASNAKLLPGRYRIDRTGTGKITVFSQAPWGKEGDYDTPITYLETHSSGSTVYFYGGGTVFITRLA